MNQVKLMLALYDATCGMQMYISKCVVRAVNAKVVNLMMMIFKK